jgi:hypothetical protein
MRAGAANAVVWEVGLPHRGVGCCDHPTPCLYLPRVPIVAHFGKIRKKYFGKIRRTEAVRPPFFSDCQKSPRLEGGTPYGFPGNGIPRREKSPPWRGVSRRSRGGGSFNKEGCVKRWFTPSVTACGGASSLKEGANDRARQAGWGIPQPRQRPTKARAEPLPYGRT